MMCAPLSKELRKKYGGVRSMPIRKDDKVRVVRGAKGNTSDKLEGKVVRVYRKRFVIHIDRLTKDKANGQQVQIPVDPSNVEITGLKIDRNRKQLLETKLNNRNQSREKKGLQAGVALAATAEDN
ncbi:ribosomal protein L24 [Batrachochytrium salamandrivorans]|nr:ribosomal protein L24 [Batrachochytrium salamandrivorans]